MSWLDVADFLRIKRCFEAQRCGSCHCGRGKANACAKATKMIESCIALDNGEQPDFSPEAIHRFVVGKSCGLSRSGKPCNHRGCMNSEKVAAWIGRYIGLSLQVA